MNFIFPNDLPHPGEKARVKATHLDPVTYYWLKIGAKLRNRSLAAQTQSLLTASVFRLKEEWLEILRYEATQQGVSPEELFKLLAMDVDKEG